LLSLPKVLLVYPPAAGARQGIQGIYYPIGIGYIASTLRSNYEVSVYDFNYDCCMGKKVNEAHIKNVLKRYPHDFLLIGGVFPKLSFIKKLISVSRKTFNVPIVVGGSSVKANLSTIDNYLNADYYVIGEGEHIVPKLLDGIINNRLQDISGISYRLNNQLITNSMALPVSNLDEISFPDRSLFGFNRYKRAFSIGNPLLYSAVIIASRGCPLNCLFCRPNFGRKVRVRSPENIIEEIDLLKKDFNINYIYFRDEVLLGGSKQNIVKFCDCVLKRGTTSFYWSGTTNARFLNRKTIGLMKRAGCTGINLGVESCSKTILKEMRKHKDLEQLREVTRACSDYGIDVGFSLITNSFSETEETLNETKDYLKSLQDQFFRSPFFINFIVPMPGTDLYDYAVNKGLVSSDHSENLLSLDDSSRHRLSYNLTKMGNEDFLGLIDSVNKELEENYYKKHLFQYLISKHTNLFHFRWKETLTSISKDNLRSIVEGLL